MELVLRVCLLVLLLDAPWFWFQRVPLQAVCGLGLLWPAFARDARSWALLTVLTSWPLFWNWPFSDNHDYLRAFTALSVALEALQRLRQDHAALTGRAQLEDAHAAKAAVVVGREHAEATAFPGGQAEGGEARDLREREHEQQQRGDECAALHAGGGPVHPATIPKEHSGFKRKPGVADPKDHSF